MSDPSDELIQPFHSELRPELSQFLQTAATGFRLIDKDCNVTHVNKTLVELSGVPVSESLAQKCYESFHGPICHTPQCPLTLILGGRKKVECTVEKQHRSGRKIPCILTATPWLDKDGQVSGIVEEFMDTTRLRDLEEELVDAQNRLELVSAQLLFAQEEERKRIAYDLHDSLGQSLTAISLSVEHSRLKLPKRYLKSLEEIGSAIKDGARELHRIIEGLRPPILDHLGIAATTFWFCRKFEEDSPNIFAVPQVDFEDIQLPSAIEISIFRVLQEAMSNAAKHANCDTIDVHLSNSNNRITLIVKDNGDGFNTALKGPDKEIAEVPEFGMAIMRERAELLNGSFSVTSTLGSGTIITASWPLTEGADEQMDRLFSGGGGGSWKRKRRKTVE